MIPTITIAIMSSMVVKAERVLRMGAPERMPLPIACPMPEAKSLRRSHLDELTGRADPAKSCSLANFAGSDAEAELLDLVEQRAVRELEELRGARAVPARTLEGAADQVALQPLRLPLHRQVGVGGGERRGRGGAQR